MKGDFTRRTFDPKKHYRGVEMQQGRVQTDADWNEQVAIDAHLRETGTKEVVGRCGAPQGAAGFRIASAALPPVFIPFPVTGSPVPVQGPAPTGSHATNAIVPTLGTEAEARLVAVASSLSSPLSSAISSPVADPFTLIVSPGRMYVDGILCELEPESEVSLTAGPVSSNLVTVAASALQAAGLQPGDWVAVLWDPLPADSAGLYARIEEIRPADVAHDQQIVRL